MADALSLVVRQHPLWWGPYHDQTMPCDIQLNAACWNDDIKEAKEALDQGANPSFSCNTSEAHKFSLLYIKKPIIICAYKGNLEIIKLLYEADIDCINDRDYFSHKTALHIAVQNNDYEMCDWLLQHGYEFYADRLRKWPLMEAAELGLLEIVKLLHKHGTDINNFDKDFFVALSYCLDFVTGKGDEDDEKHWECAKYLVEIGAMDGICYAGVEAYRYGKHTKRDICHCAAIKGDLEMLKKMSLRGFYEERRDRDEKTPLQYAKEFGHDEVVEYLSQCETKSDVNKVEIPCVVL